jgi:glycosyltransferase involved in cell wall biosynthesis
MVHLLTSPNQATVWFWRKTRYLLRDLRPNGQVAELAAKLHRQYKFDAFFGRVQAPLLADCPSLGPSFIDLDVFGTQPTGPIMNPVDRLRRLVMKNRLSRFQRVFVTKKSDADQFRLPNVQVLPCISTKCDYSISSDTTIHDNRILFVGGQWAPNQAGLKRFVERSLPIIRRDVPSATVRVVGPHDEKFLGELREHEGVETAGRVPDISIEYRQADICICPIWTGRGANVKLAEYASFGRAIVATKFSAAGFEGILEPGRDLMVADTDESFAARCVELLKDSARRSELGRNAGETAKALLSQAAIDRIVGEAVSQAFTR